MSIIEIENKIEKNYSKENIGVISPLNSACRNDNENKIFNKTSSRNHTKINNENSVKYLLKMGIDANQGGKNGDTLLVIA
ncbi:hypothetical protein U3516DRAFT_751600 [Neocallimastix sp. 'constans']